MYTYLSLELFFQPSTMYEGCSIYNETVLITFKPFTKNKDTSTADLRYVEVVGTQKNTST